MRMARWLLENAEPDPNWKSCDGKSLMSLARETGGPEMLGFLAEFGFR